MHKHLRLAAIVLVMILIIIALCMRPTSEKTACTIDGVGYRSMNMTIRGKPHRLLVADTDDKRSRGLMFVRSREMICGHEGMVFLFDEKGIQTFWNQNTLIDLDLYWMDGDRVLREEKLLNITDNGLKTYSSILPVNTVVELIR